MQGTLSSTVPLSVDTLARQRRRAIIATVLGNGLEWFDFTVYSFFAVIIAKLFFPTGNELTSLLLAVATFGVGFFMRPVGGMVLGVYADKVGRKAALSLTILLMAGGTALIGLAPTYDQIGLWAPVLIVVARLLQGFSAGGEMGSATAFLTEYAPANKRAFYSSWIQSSIGFAVLLGAAVGTFVTANLSAESLHSWGWRMPFLIGILIGPVGYFIRSRMDETPAFSAVAEEAKNDSPLADVFRTYPRETFASFSMVILWTVCTYVLLFYMPTYSVRTLHLPQSTGFLAGMFGGSMIMCFSPVVGKLADRFGRRRFLSGAAALILAACMADVRLHQPHAGTCFADGVSRRVRFADRGLHGPDSRGVLRAVPDPGSVDGPFRCVQLRGDDFRRLRTVLHHVADRVDGKQHGPRDLRDDRRGHQPVRHFLRTRSASTPSLNRRVRLIRAGRIPSSSQEDFNEHYGNQRRQRTRSGPGYRCWNTIML